MSDEVSVRWALVWCSPPAIKSINEQQIGDTLNCVRAWEGGGSRSR